MFRGKNYKESAKLIDKQALYDPKDAFDLVCKMCIRDSTNAPRPPRRSRRPALTVSTGPSYGLGPTPVSYTHLDVYKRQC